MSKKGSLDSPFKNPHGTTASETDSKGVYDHNPCPSFSKPHDVGKDGIKEKFYEEMPGKPADVLSGPMGGQKRDAGGKP